VTFTSTVDLHDGRRAATGDGLLRELGDATVLASADIRTALTLATLVDGAAPEVVLAVALAVRAVRLGHVFVDLDTVAATVAPDDEEAGVDLAALAWPEPAAWVTAVAASPLVAVGPDGPADRPVRLLGSRVYLDRYWRHERAIAADVLARSTAAPPPVDRELLAAGLDRLFAPTLAPAGAPSRTPSSDDPVVVASDRPGDDLQRVAAATAVLRRFAVVAGGPGTGKTTTVARIAALLHEQAAAAGAPAPRVALVAPTGKAATRLAEAVHAEAAGLDTSDAIRAALVATPASTIHRLLGWQPGNRSRFRHDRTNPLPHTVVIVDESSMVSLSLMAKLLDAVRPSARLVLVGDPRQLASVEAGAVLGDIVGPAARQLHLRPAAAAELRSVTGAPLDATDPGPEVAIGDGIVVLRRVHRFGGGIAAVADAIDSGDPDTVVDALRRHPADVAWIETAPDQPAAPLELDAIRDAVLGAATAVVDAARAGDGVLALEALRSVQVLCAHRRGPWGASWWRFEIERWLRTAIPGYAIGPWYPGRPLLVTENDYALGVFNGDTGVVVDGGGGRLRAVFDRRGEVLTVRPTRLAAVDSLYAITIHKAQGSQFGSVVVVLPEPTSPILTRELLYTAVTRAQHHLTVVGAQAAIRAAVTRPVARASGLADALWAHTATR
jgi:exodeoxyribonuclease V alpha subunit